MQVSEYARHATQSFALPDICVRIRKMLDDDNSNIDDIAALISLDPFLTSKLLKLANSPLFRFRSEVDNISKAVNIIGGEALYNLVMAETASSAFSHFGEDDIDLKRFWDQSLYCALVAKDIARLAKIRGSERFFLLGLMHNLGELVVASKSPEQAKRCLDFDRNTVPWVLQKRELGFTYSDCSAEIMRNWMLPAQLSYLMSSAHDEVKASENREVGVIYTAIRVALGVINDDVYPPDGLVCPVVLKFVGLDSEQLHDVMRLAKMESGKMLAIMNPTLAA